MNRIIVALVLTVAILGASPSARAECFTTTNATDQTYALGPLTYIASACEEQADDFGLVIGHPHYATTGKKCVSALNGAAGCIQTIAYLPVTWRPPLYPGECGLKAFATLTGIGCCGHACPPLTPNCQPD